MTVLEAQRLLSSIRSYRSVPSAEMPGGSKNPERRPEPTYLPIHPCSVFASGDPLARRRGNCANADCSNVKVRSSWRARASSPISGGASFGADTGAEFAAGIT